ncbi:MAG: uroporphyrinogen decarboxylase family protein [Candidatus Adiutricales bacterium]
MSKMTGQERMLKVLNLEEPDRVPHWDTVHPRVKDAILPGSSFPEFTDYIDLDAVGNFDKVNAWSYESVDTDKRIRRDQWGGLVQYTTETLGHPMEPAIKTEADLDRYIPPDPDEEWRYETIRRLLKRYKGNRAVYAHATDVFDIASDSLLGPEAYYNAMIKNPALVDRVNDIVLDFNLAYLKNCLELGVDYIYISGDFAMTKGPMVSPKHTARFLTPPLKKQVDLAREYNVPVLKHTDGNIWKIFDLIVDTGINALHPIDPIAGMDLGEVKAKYGDRLCLAGNVNCGATLSWGSVQDVRREVKDCIRKAGPGGGFICTSGNSIHSGVKPENYLAMVKAIHEFGLYPLDMERLES